MFRLLVVAVCLVRWSQAQTVSLGDCPSLKPVADFDMIKYAGTWFENRKNRRYFFILDSGLKCVSETYDIDADGTIQVTVNGTQFLGGRPHQHKGMVRLPSPTIGRLGFTFVDLPFSPSNVPAAILDTDYTSYSVVWSCSKAGPFNTQIVWVLTRDQIPDKATVEKALNVLERSGFGKRAFLITDQKNCGVKRRT